MDAFRMVRLHEGETRKELSEDIGTGVNVMALLGGGRVVLLASPSGNKNTDGLRRAERGSSGGKLQGRATRKGGGGKGEDGKERTRTGRGRKGRGGDEKER